VLYGRVFPFFHFTFVIGNLVILNLFLSLLLTSFGSNILTKNEDEENKISEAIDRIRRFCRFILNQKQKKEIHLENPIRDEAHVKELSIVHEDIDMPPDFCPWHSQCLPKVIESRWISIRCFAHSIVEHRYFQLIITISIIVISITLVSLIIEKN
jgi:hypothetical protein